MKHYADLTVHNKEVSFRFGIQPADPDTGVMDPYVEEWEVTAVNGVSVNIDVAELLSDLFTYDDICIRLMEEYNEQA